MCGIFGVVTPHNKTVFVDKRILAHRGPDDYGGLVWDGIASPYLIQEPMEIQSKSHKALVLFEHFRLSILDLSKAGWQPMGTPDGRFFIVYNGEVYNYKELRKELEREGYRFQSQTDTEVVLYAYTAWGAQALQKFIGMFALAILDTQKRKVFLARDCFGIKPLYYMHYQKGLAFASEIKALLALPDVKAQAHPQRVYDYLRYGLTDHEAETLFQGIYHVPPAHFMIVSIDNPGQARLERYWDPLPDERLTLSFDKAATRLRELFLESVQLHLRSDVPLGTALSGGIDSSSIVSAIRYLEPQAEIHTFSFIPGENSAISEDHWVNIVGNHVGAFMHKVRPRPEELPRDLDDLIFAQDEPFGSTSIYAQYRVFRLARENGIKVMLDGQGADELLAGYSSYYVARVLSLLRQKQFDAFVQFLMRIRKVPASQGTSYLLSRLAASLLPAQWQELPRKMLREELFPQWMNKTWFAQRDVHSRNPWRNDWPEALRQQLLRDLQTTSLPHLLRYEDRDSMWHSIESRVPFLTPQLTHFVLALPEEYILAPDGTTKAVFRKAMEGIVPQPILNRRDKIGFATPEREWLSALRPWIENVLSGESAQAIPALRVEELKKQGYAMLEGKQPFKWTLWRWVNLIRWTERFGVAYA